MLQGVQFQIDPVAFIIGIGSIAISTYIALLLARLTRKFSESEALRSINQQWDGFHTAMLDERVHELFWTFVRSPEPFNGLGDRSHHIVLMYLNNIHTEYNAYVKSVFDNYDVAYIDRLLAVFVGPRAKVIELAMASGYDADFIKFVEERLGLLAAPSPLTPSRDAYIIGNLRG